MLSSAPLQTDKQLAVVLEKVPFADNLSVSHAGCYLKVQVPHLYSSGSQSLQHFDHSKGTRQAECDFHACPCGNFPSRHGPGVIHDRCYNSWRDELRVRRHVGKQEAVVCLSSDFALCTSVPHDMFLPHRHKRSPLRACTQPCSRGRTEARESRTGNPCAHIRDRCYSGCWSLRNLCELTETTARVQACTSRVEMTLVNHVAL